MNNYLYHHGILGQKWGIRRYQNSDGSLTDAGRKRYAKLAPQDKAKRLIKIKKAAKVAQVPAALVAIGFAMTGNIMASIGAMTVATAMNAVQVGAKDAIIDLAVNTATYPGSNYDKQMDQFRSNKRYK